MGNQKKRKWTIFFVIKATDLHILDLIAMLNEIRAIRMSDQTAIRFCITMALENRPGVESGNPALVCSTSEASNPGTLFYRLAKADGTSEFLNDLIFENYDAGFDITDPRDLSTFFENSDSERNIVFTWEHGSGYGIFKSVAHSVQPVLEYPSSENIFRRFPMLDITTADKLHSKSSDKEAREIKILTVDELAEAINIAFDGKKIEMVIMMNCYMQLFDCGYALRKNVRYLVAPETYMFFNGYNYQFLFKKLGDNPDISAKRFAKYVVRSFETKIYPDPNSNAPAMPASHVSENYTDIGSIAKSATSIFANDLSYYPLMTFLIERLTKALEKEIHKNKAELLMARLNSREINDSLNIVDFFNLLKNFQLTLGRSWQFIAVTCIMMVRRLIIVESYIGSAYYNDFKRKKFPSGFSIFFPMQPKNVIVSRRHFDFFKNTSFGKRGRWYSFVMQFMESRS